MQLFDYTIISQQKNQHCGIIFERQEWQPMSLLKILAERLFPSESPLPHTMKL